MPSATSRATAGATIARSSSPSVPASPACGLSPAIASRGRAMPKPRGKIVRDDAPGFDHEFGREMLEDFPQRQMDRHRHDREFRRPQHHDRPQRLAGRFLHQPRQELGMSGFGEAPIVKHVLGNRIGDDGRRRARHDVGDRAADRSDRGGRAGAVRPARLGAHRNIERHNRQRRAEMSPPRPLAPSRWRSERRGRAERPAGGEIRDRQRHKMAAGQVRTAAARSPAQDRGRSRRVRQASMPKVARSCFSSPICLIWNFCIRSSPRRRKSSR